MYLLSERGERREKEERNINVCLPLSRPPNGNPAHNPGMCSDRGANWQPLGSQAGAQSTEPHQPGLPFQFRYPSLWL